MKRLSAVLIIAAIVVPTLAAAETWTNVPLIDKNCVEKVKADPDKHETSCLIMCAKSGYGLLTSDGTWIKFDAKGNEEALKALKATTKENGIRVTVTGERAGDMIKVATLKID
jgi:phosphoribosylamine-glycine ligase